MVMVRRQEGRRAKVAGTHVMAHGKFRPSGISGVERDLLPMTFFHDLPRDARRSKLSVCYHMGTGHFRTPSLLSSYHHHLTSLPSSVTQLILLVSS